MLARNALSHEPPHKHSAGMIDRNPECPSNPVPTASPVVGATQWPMMLGTRQHSHHCHCANVRVLCVGTICRPAKYIELGLSTVMHCMAIGAIGSTATIIR